MVCRILSAVLTRLSFLSGRWSPLETQAERNCLFDVSGYQRLLTAPNGTDTIAISRLEIKPLYCAQLSSSLESGPLGKRQRKSCIFAQAGCRQDDEAVPLKHHRVKKRVIAEESLATRQH